MDPKENKNTSARKAARNARKKVRAQEKAAKKTPLKANMGSSGPGGAYSRGGVRPETKRNYKFESASNFGFGKGEFANNSSKQENTTEAKVDPVEKTKAQTKSITPKASAEGRVQKQLPVEKATVKESKSETAKDIRKAGRLRRKTERKENRIERRTMRKDAREERKESRRSSNASIQRVKNKVKAEKQQSRQDQKLKNTQAKIAKKEQKQYDRQLKRNPFLGDQTNASLATSKVGGSGPSYEAAQQEKALQSDLNKTAFLMKSPVKMGQTMQGVAPVQNNPYQDVNQMNYNFDPLSQQRAQQMQMPPVNNSPFNITEKQKTLPKQIQEAILAKEKKQK